MAIVKNQNIVRTLIFAIIVIFTAFIAGKNAFVNISHKINPELALKLAPRDAIAMATFAELSVGDGTIEPSQVDAIDKLARDSIEELAINGKALRALGFVGLKNNNEDLAFKSFDVSNRQSRRDLGTILFLIEKTAYQQNIEAVLRHYDSALSIYGESHALLFPILTNALEDEAIRKPFIALVDDNRGWMGPFLRFAVSNSKKPTIFLEILERSAPLPNTSEYSSLRSELLRSLIASGEYERAIKFYNKQGGADVDVLKSIGLNEVSVDPRYTPFTWEPHTSNGASVAFTNKSDAIDYEGQVYLEPKFSGIVARKLVQLSQGRYKFRVEHSFSSDRTDGGITWRLACLEQNERKEIWRSGELSGLNPKQLEAELTVPDACSIFVLELVANASQFGTEFTFDRLSFSKI